MRIGSFIIGGHFSVLILEENRSAVFFLKIFRNYRDFNASEWYDVRRKTEEGKTMRKQLLRMAAILLCVLGLWSYAERCTVYAKEEQSVETFSGDVTMLRQENNGYVMQVTATNNGADFTGTVQVVFAGSDSENTAYNTEITLPAQGKKQFTINITNTAVDKSQEICVLNFLDEKGDVLQSIEQKNVFQDAVKEAAVGVLSDDYAGLGFLEAKGETIETNNGYFPVKLTELDRDDLKESLDGLYYLVIDRFDTSSLGRDTVEAVQDWVRGGGWLIVGTGEYGEQTLSGFDRDFMDVEAVDVSEPGEENIVSDNAEPYGYRYSLYTNDGVDFTNMAIADLEYNRMGGSFYESSDNPAVCSPMDRGGILVYYCSLGDAELQKLSGYTVASMYEEFKYFGYQYDAYSEWEYIRERALSYIDHANTDVDFTWLKVMIFLYVVAVGPVLYLILRKGKRCEWYWICVPAAGVLFIAGVYFLGQGARVKETKVYSVTSQRVDGGRKDTYFLAYHSGIRPWEVRLQEDFDMAGPGAGQNTYYYVGYSQNMEDYLYAIGNDGEGILAGIKPEENFDSGFFYAAGNTKSRGTISCEDLTGSGRGLTSGIITNATDCDMAYMAVWYRNNIVIFPDVKAGETVDLKNAVKEGRCVYEGYVGSCDELFYDMIPMYRYDDDVEYEADDMAALLIGLGIADNVGSTGGRQIGVMDQADEEDLSESEQAVIAGVVRDYDKIADGKCNEISYGCLYSYGAVEGGRNASD